MKVILLENIKKIGNIGEIIDVKRGFGRNYLIANRKAMYASKDNIKQVNKIKDELAKKDLEKKKNAKILSDKLNNKIYIIKKLVTENKDLYGSVKPTEITKLIYDKDQLEVKPSSIQLPKEIKTIGLFKVVIDLHSDVQAEINVKVEILDPVR